MDIIPLNVYTKEQKEALTKCKRNREIYKLCKEFWASEIAKLKEKNDITH